MMGMDNIWAERSDRIIQVLSPDPDVGIQLVIVKVIKGLYAAWVSREAGEVKIKFPPLAVLPTFKEDGVYLKWVSACGDRLMFRHNNQDLMPHSGEFLGDVEHINATARSLEREVVWDQYSQGRSPFARSRASIDVVRIANKISTIIRLQINILDDLPMAAHK